MVFGETDETVTKTLAEYGATRVLFIADPAINDYLVAPKAEALAQVAADQTSRRSRSPPLRRARRSRDGLR